MNTSGFRHLTSTHIACAGATGATEDSYPRISSAGPVSFYPHIELYNMTLIFRFSKIIDISYIVDHHKYMLRLYMRVWLYSDQTMFALQDDR